MIVTLNINNDAELRAHIKEAIRGQIKSLAREEMMNILKEVLQDKMPTIDPNVVAKEAIVKLIRDTLDNGGWNRPSFIQEEARKEINKLVKEKFQV